MKLDTANGLRVATARAFIASLLLRARRALQSSWTAQLCCALAAATVALSTANAQTDVDHEANGTADDPDLGPRLVDAITLTHSDGDIRASIYHDAGRDHLAVHLNNELVLEQSFGASVEGAMHTLDVHVREVRGHASLVEIRFFQEQPNEDVERLWVLAPSQGWTLLWSGRVTNTDGGDRLHVADLNGDQEDEIFISFEHPRMRACALGPLPIRPRVLDWATRRFRHVDLRPSLTPTAVLEPTATSWPDRTPRVARWHHVTSDASAPLPPGTGPAPASLGDPDANEIWAHHPPGSGQGEMVFGSVSPLAPTIGVEIVPPTDRPPPRRMALITDAHTYVLHLQPTGAQSFVLPEADDTRCITLLLLDTPDAAYGIQTARVITALDTMSAQELIRHLAATATSTEVSAELRALARDLLRTIPDAGSILLDVAMLESAETQRDVAGIFAEMSLDIEAWLHAFDDERLDPEALAIALRGATTRDARVSTMIAQRAAEAPDGHPARPALLEAYLDTMSPGTFRDDAATLVPLVNRVTDEERELWIRIVGSWPTSEVLPLLADEVRGDAADPARDHAILRAMTLATRDRFSEPDPLGTPERPLPAPLINALERAIASDNGTTSRLGIWLAGELECAALTTDLEHLLADDPSPHIRAQAARALGAHDRLGWRHRESPARNTASLARALSDASPDVRIEAATALRDAWHDPEYWRADALQNLASERWPEVRLPLAAALARTSQSATFEPFWALLLGDDESVMSAALEQASRNPDFDPRDLIPMLTARSETPAVQVRILRAFAAHPSDEVVQAALPHAESPSVVVVLAAIEVIEQGGRPDDVPALIALLQHSEVSVRLAAARSAMRMAPERAAPEVERLLAAEEDERAIEAMRGLLETWRP